MTAEDTQWDSLVADYIRRVEQALSYVNHPRRQAVLDDLRSHLAQRYAELPADQRSPRQLSTIIAEMGAPEEYAQMLGGEAAQPASCAQAGALGRAAEIVLPTSYIMKKWKFECTPSDILIQSAANGDAVSIPISDLTKRCSLSGRTLTVMGPNFRTLLIIRLDDVGTALLRFWLTGHVKKEICDDARRSLASGVGCVLCWPIFLVAAVWFSWSAHEKIAKYPDLLRGRAFYLAGPIVGLGVIVLSMAVGIAMYLAGL
jgi:hypothetical protein